MDSNTEQVLLETLNGIKDALRDMKGALLGLKAQTANKAVQSEKLYIDLELKTNRDGSIQHQFSSGNGFSCNCYSKKLKGYFTLFVSSKHPQYEHLKNLFVSAGSTYEVVVGNIREETYTKKDGSSATSKTAWLDSVLKENVAVEDANAGNKYMQPVDDGVGEAGIPDSDIPF